MSLTFVGPSGTFERRWIVYAMLCDNVQHHLQGSHAGGFEQLHRLADALRYGKTVVRARQLHEELSRVNPILCKPISELAVSSRTRAVQHLLFPLPEAPTTSLVSEIDWEPPYPVEGAVTLGDVFGSLVTELALATANAGPNDVLTALDS